MARIGHENSYSALPLEDARLFLDAQSNGVRVPGLAGLGMVEHRDPAVEVAAGEERLVVLAAGVQVAGGVRGRPLAGRARPGGKCSRLVIPPVSDIGHATATPRY
jgi:hypothetical protein